MRARLRSAPLAHRLALRRPCGLPQANSARLENRFGLLGPTRVQIPPPPLNPAFSAAYGAVSTLSTCNAARNLWPKTRFSSAHRASFSWLNGPAKDETRRPSLWYPLRALSLQP
jgi:hypothetical protein